MDIQQGLRNIGAAISEAATAVRNVLSPGARATGNAVRNPTMPSAETVTKSISELNASRIGNAEKKFNEAVENQTLKEESAPILGAIKTEGFQNEEDIQIQTNASEADAIRKTINTNGFLHDEEPDIKR